MSALTIIAVLAALHLADIVTTAIALRRGLTEANPIARRLFGFMGVLPASAALKLIGSAPMVALVLLYPSWWPLPLAYAFLLAGVVANNILELKDS